jgi:hypothetical protein
MRAAASATIGTRSQATMLAGPTRAAIIDNRPLPAPISRTRMPSFSRNSRLDRTFKGIVQRRVVQHSGVPERDNDRDQTPQLIPNVLIFWIEMQIFRNAITTSCRCPESALRPDLSEPAHDPARSDEPRRNAEVGYINTRRDPPFGGFLCLLETAITSELPPIQR